MKISRAYILLALVSCVFSCTRGPKAIYGNVAGQPDIFPDYRDITIPENIAPLNFVYNGEEECAIFVNGECVPAKSGNKFIFGRRQWQRWMQQDSLSISLVISRDGEWMAFEPFSIRISHDKIDPYVSYRLIPPGYQGWKVMGLFQRDLTSYKQTPIYENRLGNDNCVNCHTPGNRNPGRRVFHVRADFGGTILMNDGEMEKLNTKTDSTISALVYPYWHPSGKYVAFSVNATKQSFHASDPNRIEVFDSASDVVVYDVRNHEIFWSPLTRTAAEFETFPSFSPDGKYLYFCSTKAVEKMPQDYDKAKYDLKRIAFDPENGSFGDVLETVYDASSQNLSVSFPRVSPDGHYLCFTRHGYGNFSIWHKDADLWMINMETGESYPLEDANSDDVDSYHSWSGNSRWMIFSSRRDDGLYTKLYITHIDSEGKASKPFLLPQKDPKAYYDGLMFSYNIPEFMEDRVKVSQRETANLIRNSKGTDVKVRSLAAGLTP